MGKNKDGMVLKISLVDVGRDEMNSHESDLFDSLPGETFVVIDELKKVESELLSNPKRYDSSMVENWTVGTKTIEFSDKEINDILAEFKESYGEE